MEPYPSNSHKATKRIEEPEEPTKKLEKIVEGDVIRKKKSLGRRVSDTFINGDLRTVRTFVLFEVLLPAAKDMLADAMSQGVEKMLFGEALSSSRRGRGYRPQQNDSYISYNRFSRPNNSRDRREEPRGPSRRARATHDFDEIILATRVEAESVVDRLFDLVSKYEIATVTDLYALVGISGDYTDDNWGWTDLRGAGVTRVRNGYLLDLPRPESLN